MTYFKIYFKGWRKGFLFTSIVAAIIFGFVTGMIQNFASNPFYIFGALLGFAIGVYLVSAVLLGLIYAGIRCAIDKGKYTIVPNYSEEEMEARLLQKFTSEINHDVTYKDTPANKEMRETCKVHSTEGISSTLHYRIRNINENCSIIAHFGSYSSRKQYKENVIPLLNGNLQNDAMAIINTLKNTTDAERRTILNSYWRNIAIGCVITYKGVFITIALHNLDVKYLKEKENKIE